ncbi:MAG TPA: hypothetical protein VHY08_04500 [Bacillota bacterium]|nr:hypothetical protein [Bacillota bacterium]
MNHPITYVIFLLGGILLLISSKFLAEIFGTDLFLGPSRYEGIKRGVGEFFFTMIGICSIVFSSLMLGPYLIKTLGIPLLVICLILVTIIVIWAKSSYKKRQEAWLKSKRVWIKPVKKHIKKY